MSDSHAFTLIYGDAPIARFNGVNGLQFETPANFRHGNSPIFYPIKMPGLGKVGNVSLGPGRFDDAGGFAALEIAFVNGRNAASRMVVEFGDDSGQPKMTWTLNNAWPTKITGSDTGTDETHIGFETIELAYESVTVADP